LAPLTRTSMRDGANRSVLVGSHSGTNRPS
jgi:hypothetical protein